MTFFVICNTCYSESLVNFFAKTYRKSVYLKLLFLQFTRALVSAADKTASVADLEEPGLS